MKSLIYIPLLLCLIENVYSYFVTIDAHAEECYFEKVNRGTKLSLMFEVAEGGFLDIDVKVCFLLLCIILFLLLIYIFIYIIYIQIKFNNLNLRSSACYH